MLICLFFFGVGSTSAQSPGLSPRAQALAGGTPSAAVGTGAMYFNPAGIAGEVGQRSWLMVGGVGAFAGGDLLQFDVYNRSFTGGNVIDTDEARALINEWFDGPDSGLKRVAGATAEVVPFAATFQRARTGLGVGLRMRSSSRIGLNGGWLDLLLIGTEEQRAVPLNATTSFMSTMDITVAVARRRGDGLMSVGFAPRIIFGTNFADLELTSVADIGGARIEHRYDYAIRVAGGLSGNVVDQVNLFSADALGNSTFSPSLFEVNGVGAGFDAGVTYRLSEMLRVGASLTDVGFVRWFGEAQTVRPVSDAFVFEGIAFDVNRLQDEFGGSFVKYGEHVLDSLARDAYQDVDRTAGGFTTALSAVVHGGMDWSLHGGRSTIALGTTVGVNDAPSTITRYPSLHLGIEHSLGRGDIRFPIRGGVHTGGASAVSLAFGFGFESGSVGFDVGIAGTPRTNIIGRGGRYAVGMSALRVQL